MSLGLKIGIYGGFSGKTKEVEIMKAASVPEGQVQIFS